MGEAKWSERAKKAWDDRARDWHARSQALWDTGSRRIVLPMVRKHLQPDTDGWVLDAGCGDGYGSKKLVAAGYRVLGVDLSEEMIAAAKNNGENERLRFQTADVTHLPFEKESFVGALAINALEWVENPLRGLSELHRVLKHRGMLFLAVLGPTAEPRVNSYRRLYGESVICNTMMPWECAKLCTENGWEIVDGEPVFRESVDVASARRLPVELQQALSFLWLFALCKK